MVVFSLVRAPKRIRGVLSRYCLELRSGLFIGRLDKRMRDKLWAIIEDHAKTSTSAVMCWNEPTAQGYAFVSLGKATRIPVHYDGLWLVAEAQNDKIQAPPKKKR